MGIKLGSGGEGVTKVTCKGTSVRDNPRLQGGLRPGQIQQYDIRVLLHSLEYDFTAVGGYVEVANIEVGSQVGQLPLGAGLEIDEPEIFVLNFSTKEHQATPSGWEDQASRPAR